MKQVWFSENISPIFTKEQRDEYRKLVENQVYPLGNSTGGRHLLRCLCEDFQPIMDFLISVGKVPIVCGAKFQDGQWDTLYPVNQAEYALFMQPINTVDINGNPTIINAIGNTSSGWASWDDVYVAPKTIV